MKQPTNGGDAFQQSLMRDAKFKTISITFNIPADYKFLARHPFGSWSLFKRRPELTWEDEETAADDIVRIFNWKTQEDEIEILDHDALMVLNDDRISGDWKNSVIEI